MPSNPNKPDRIARVAIDKFLVRLLPRHGKADYVDFVREILLTHDVSEQFVESFIKRYYIDTGAVVLRDGILYPPTKGGAL